MPLNQEQQLRLDQEIEAERNNIKTDKLDISYGELANLYESKELVIRPEYQRLFRWSSTQKTRFIESILLGFPTPAIFVSEDTKGVWELVDGLQRVSTVLEFMSVLKNETGQLMPPSTLARVDVGHKLRLASIDNTAFSELSLQSRLSIKRAGCLVEVIKIGSLSTMKYEVFERLNTGGSELSAQEVRNCIFRATDGQFVQWIETLATFPPFADNLGLSEQQKATMHDQGLVRRYFAMKHGMKSSSMMLNRSQLISFGMCFRKKDISRRIRKIHSLRKLLLLLERPCKTILGDTTATESIEGDSPCMCLKLSRSVLHTTLATYGSSLRVNCMKR